MEKVVLTALISSDFACLLINRAIAKAKSLGCTVCVAVVDAGGRLKAYQAMDGAPVIAELMSQQKARTALLGLGSGHLGELMQVQPAAMLSMGLQPGINYLGGGLPISLNGELVGAIGVGGGLVEQDVACAEAALAPVIDC